MRSLASLLLLALLGLAPLTVRAQSAPTGPAAPTWAAFVGDQIAANLAAPSADTRATALALASYLARFTDVDLAPAVPALVRVYRTDAEVQHRAAAAAALLAIGDEEGMQHVRAGVRAQPAGQAQRTALAALMSYYGPATFAGDEEVADLAVALIAQR